MYYTVYIYVYKDMWKMFIYDVGGVSNEAGEKKI